MYDTGVNLYGGNIDSITGNMAVATSTGTQGTFPDGAQKYGVLTQFASNCYFSLQVYVDSSKNIYQRIRNNGTWGGWTYTPSVASFYKNYNTLADLTSAVNNASCRVLGTYGSVHYYSITFNDDSVCEIFGDDAGNFPFNICCHTNHDNATIVVLGDKYAPTSITMRLWRKNGSKNIVFKMGVYSNAFIFTRRGSVTIVDEGSTFDTSSYTEVTFN